MFVYKKLKTDLKWTSPDVLYFLHASQGCRCWECRLKGAKPQSLYSLVGEEINKPILRRPALLKECKLGGILIRGSVLEEEEFNWILNKKVSTRVSGRELGKGFLQKREQWRKRLKTGRNLHDWKGFFVVVVVVVFWWYNKGPDHKHLVCYATMFNFYSGVTLGKHVKEFVSANDFNQTHSLENSDFT